MIKYISTRGGGNPRSFTDVLLAGLAPDGGLYVPDRWPQFDHGLLDHLHGLRYTEVAMQVLTPFIGDAISKEDLQRIIDETYCTEIFDHSSIAPLTQVGPNAWILELFRGPTLSFKDYAMQLLGRLFDHVLEQKGERITIVGATSGDTGSAAIEACKGCKHIDIFILHPQGRTSEVQRRQMTTVDAPNVHNIALEGTFDDCQAIVKALFGDQKLREDLNLSAVNSINWARIMAQTVYYFVASLALGAPGRPVSFTVPTGNFGNVFAGYAARRMGLPIHRLGIATNRNDILTRFFETGEMKIDKVMPSLSPSMDIQISSNFERYLYDLMDHDSAALTKTMEEFKTRRVFKIGDNLMNKARAEFTANRCSDLDTMAMMKSCYAQTGILIDPHTAVALHGATDMMEQDPAVPMIVLACAHPSKFPQAVQQAVGIKPPAVPRLMDVMQKAEHYTALPNDVEKIKDFVLGNVSR
ncbi:MAG: threonine synthase [Rhodospirillales bacterium]|nr:threonine synthase [Rhodospirillales bacterium]MCB9997172.1 threonine synthase [Rhodospirillales bacterium]